MVLFSFKPEIDKAGRDWLLGEIAGLAKIPSVRQFAVGRLLEPREEWYKPRLTTDYEWSLSMEFDGEDALYAYQTDPYHVAVAQEIRRRVAVIKVMDFVSLQK
jgi:hypothetical protein